MTDAPPPDIAMRKRLALVLLEPACVSWQSGFEQSDALPWTPAPWAPPWSVLMAFTQAWMRLFWSFTPGWNWPSTGGE